MKITQSTLLLLLLFYYPAIVHLRLNKTTENCFSFVTKDEYEHFAPYVASFSFIYLFINLFINLLIHLLIYLLIYDSFVCGNTM
jgi:hypothetical protein